MLRSQSFTFAQSNTSRTLHTMLSGQWSAVSDVEGGLVAMWPRWINLVDHHGSGSVYEKFSSQITANIPISVSFSSMLGLPDSLAYISHLFFTEPVFHSTKESNFFPRSFRVMTSNNWFLIKYARKPSFCSAGD